VFSVLEIQSLNPLKRVKFISIRIFGSAKELAEGLNPLKRVKFISMDTENSEMRMITLCLNPLKRVKFISIQGVFDATHLEADLCLNPLKRVKFISIRCGYSDGLWLCELSQSPQTGQVYFNECFWNCNSERRSVCLNPLKRVKFISMGFH